MIITRRSMLFGILAAPLIVRAGSLMAVKPIDLEAVYDPYHSEGWGINRQYVGPVEWDVGGLEPEPVRFTAHMVAWYELSPLEKWS